MRSSPQQRCAEAEDVPSLENPLKTSASAKLVWRRRSQDRRGESRESCSLWPPSGAGSFSSLSDARGGGTVRGLPRPLFVCAPGAEEMMDFGDCISSGRAGGSAGRCGEGGRDGGWVAAAVAQGRVASECQNKAGRGGKQAASESPGRRVLRDRTGGREDPESAAGGETGEESWPWRAGMSPKRPGTARCAHRVRRAKAAPRCHSCDSGLATEGICGTRG